MEWRGHLAGWRILAREFICVPKRRRIGIHTDQNGRERHVYLALLHVVTRKKNAARIVIYDMASYVLCPRIQRPILRPCSPGKGESEAEISSGEKLYVILCSGGKGGVTVGLSDYGIEPVFQNAEPLVRAWS